MGQTGFTVNCTDGTANWQLRIDNDCVQLYNAPPPTNPFYVTGIGSQFDNLSPFTNGYQLFPRYSSDIQEVVGTKTPTWASEISISPNPVFDELSIRSEVVFEKIELRDPVGRLVFTKNSAKNSEKIIFENRPSGVYFLTFFAEGKSWTTRVLKL
jgi:hypothetical protein